MEHFSSSRSACNGDRQRRVSDPASTIKKVIEVFEITDLPHLFQVPCTTPACGQNAYLASHFAFPGHFARVDISVCPGRATISTIETARPIVENQ